jgi:hypothetical protein
MYTSTPIRLHGVVLNYLSTGATIPLPHGFFVMEKTSKVLISSPQFFNYAEKIQFFFCSIYQYILLLTNYLLLTLTPHNDNLYIAD